MLMEVICNKMKKYDVLRGRPKAASQCIHGPAGFACQRPFFMLNRSRHAHQPQCAKRELNATSMPEIASSPRKYTPCSIGQFISYPPGAM